MRLNSYITGRERAVIDLDRQALDRMRQTLDKEKEAWANEKIAWEKKMERDRNDAKFEYSRKVLIIQEESRDAKIRLQTDKARHQDDFAEFRMRNKDREDLVVEVTRLKTMLSLGHKCLH
ncbi:hypothetical protein BGX24_007287 [Mortierella sp. AD032]|nr:hypothetical protein BGX24_007287 [Mortierella sp. AD032]